MMEKTSPELPEPTVEDILSRAKKHARTMKKGSQRKEIPVRARFIRDIHTPSGATANTPLKNLVKHGDRDGITLRLYFALLWRCSAPPYNTEIPATQWAELLGLAPPTSTYPRRVANAIKRLEDQKLISVERTKGKTSVITLLDESGNGQEYSPPRGGRDPFDRWVKIPIEIWQKDTFYDLKTPGLAMMLAILAERASENEPVWWSEKRFQHRIGFTPSTRARGAQQLVKAGFLKVIKKQVASTPGRFSRNAVRSTYLLSFNNFLPRTIKSAEDFSKLLKP